MGLSALLSTPHRAVISVISQDEPPAEICCAVVSRSCREGAAPCQQPAALVVCCAGHWIPHRFARAAGTPRDQQPTAKPERVSREHGALQCHSYGLTTVELPLVRPDRADCERH